MVSLRVSLSILKLLEKQWAQSYSKIVWPDNHRPYSLPEGKLQKSNRKNPRRHPHPSRKNMILDFDFFHTRHVPTYY
ncbi:MAG: hypothetical protein QG606_593 [Patescibacteria group bacterium]|nr:hypothetical protein [Patescibacteria group bacterium]